MSLYEQEIGRRTAEMQEARVTSPLYERVGRTPFFTALVDHFYGGVADDPVLRSLYPEEDLGPATVRLRDFLVQYWGGPTTYSDERGHPRLRMRHNPYVIGEVERDRWLHHMRAAVDASSAEATERDELLAYFDMAAEAMRND
jgi:hemoglobin